MAATREHTAHRGKHTYRYWKRHDKQSYECPDCDRGVGEVDRLEVHHKDGDPTNGDRDDLIALCRTCHLARHGRVYDPPSVEKWKRRFLSIGE